MTEPRERGSCALCGGLSARKQHSRSVIKFGYISNFQILAVPAWPRPSPRFGARQPISSLGTPRARELTRWHRNL